MTDAISEALSRRCTTGAAQPWLFFREGWAWRWWSWEQARQRLELLYRGERTHGAETSGSAGAEGVLLELATQMIDLEPRLLDALWGAAAALEQRLGESRRAPRRARRWLGTPRRRVAVDSPALGPLARHVGRAWSIAVGAALVLPAGPDDWTDSVLWSRPTDLWTSAEQLGRLAQQVERRRALPAGLRRLQAVAVENSSAEVIPQRAIDRRAVVWLEENGVSVVRFPPRGTSPGWFQASAPRPEPE